MLSERRRSTPLPEPRGTSPDGAPAHGAVTRPVAVRLAAASGSQGEPTPVSPPSAFRRSSGLGQPVQLQYKSAWARYDAHADAHSHSPPPAASPPQPQLSVPARPVARRPEPPQPLQQEHRAFGIQAAYIASLKAALSGQLAAGLGGGGSAAQPPSPGRGFPAPVLPGSLSPAARSPISQLKQERPDPANGSLAILPEPLQSRYCAAAPPQQHWQPPSPPPPQQQEAAQAAAPPAGDASVMARISQQLEELLRGQAAAGAGALPPRSSGGAEAPFSSPPAASQPSVGSYPSFPRFASADAGLRARQASLLPCAEPDTFQLEAARAAAAAAGPRRWGSVASLASEQSGAALPGSPSWPAGLPPALLGGLSPTDGQALLQSLQLLCQANEMAAVANQRIQAFSAAASANLQGMGGAAGPAGRKRGAPEGLFDREEAAAAKRHHSVGGDAGGVYPCGRESGRQVCAECGTTSTPTWRRSGRRLMCNACGLRKSRSMRTALRNASMPVPLPKREAF